jgi:hypothetical protein
MFFAWDVYCRQASLTPVIRLEDPRLIKSKQSIDLACVGLQTAVGKCFELQSMGVAIQPCSL